VSAVLPVSSECTTPPMHLRRGRACCDQRGRDLPIGGDLLRERSRSRLRFQLEILQL